MALDEIYRFHCRVASNNGLQCVLVGWAPRNMPLQGRHYPNFGYWANCMTGDLNWCYQPPGATTQAAKQGRLLQNGKVISVYDRTNGTVSFQWQDQPPQSAFIHVPKEPQLYPAFVFCYKGDTVELLADSWTRPEVIKMNSCYNSRSPSCNWKINDDHRRSDTVRQVWQRLPHSMGPRAQGQK